MTLKRVHQTRLANVNPVFHVITQQKWNLSATVQQNFRIRMRKMNALIRVADAILCTYIFALKIIYWFCLSSVYCINFSTDGQLIHLPDNLESSEVNHIWIRFLLNNTTKSGSLTLISIKDKFLTVIFTHIIFVIIN